MTSVTSQGASLEVHPWDHQLRHATCLTGKETMRTEAQRRFRAAVYAVMVASKLQYALNHRRLLKDPMYVYQYAYEEPVFDWEDTTVPPIQRGLQREASLKVEDMFLPEEEYLQKLSVAELFLLDEEYRRKGLNKMAEIKYEYEEPVFDWEDTAAPKVRDSMKREASLTVDDVFLPEEEYRHKLLSKLVQLKYGPKKMVHKHRLHNAVAAIMATNKLAMTLDENMHPRNKFHALEHAMAVQPAVNEVLHSQEIYHKLHLQLEMRQKFRAAVLAIIALHRLETKARIAMHKNAQEIATLMRCHHHAMLELKVRKNLALLGSNTRPLFHRLHHHHHHAHGGEMDGATMSATNESNSHIREARHSGVVKLGWAVAKLRESAE